MLTSREEFKPSEQMALICRGDGLSAAQQRSARPRSAGRVLHLSGTWGVPGESFSLEAVLAVAGTHVEGPVRWTRNGLPVLSGVESVRGSLTAMSMEFAGVSAERGLACDQYRIALHGDDRCGRFDGISRAFGGWRGRLSGVYRFQDAASSGT